MRPVLWPCYIVLAAASMPAATPAITYVTNPAGVTVSAAPPGASLQIHGSGFGSSQGSNFLAFGTFLLQPPNPIVFQTWSDTTISFTIPGPSVVPAGSYSLCVDLWDGQIAHHATQSNGLSFTVQPTPLQIFSLMGSGTTAGGVYSTNRGATVSINGVGLGAFQQGNNPCVAPKGVVNLTGAAGGLTSNNYSYDSQQSQVVFGLPETLSPGAYQLFLTDGAGGTSSKLALTITSAPPSFFILRNGPQLTVVGPNPVAQA